MHGLCHIAADVLHLGPLDAWSAFPFENYMSSVKRMMRKPEQPLEQLCNRLTELRNAPTRSMSTASQATFSVEHECGPLIPPFQGPQFKKAKLPGNVVIAAGKNNSCWTLNDGRIISVQNFVYDSSGAPFLIGKEFLQRRDLYTRPCQSTMLGICIVSHLSGLCSWPVESIFHKCLKVSFKKEIVIFPLLHATVSH